MLICSSQYTELTSLLNEITSFIDINRVSNHTGKVIATKTIEIEETHSPDLFKPGLGLW